MMKNMIPVENVTLCEISRDGGKSKKEERWGGERGPGVVHTGIRYFESWWHSWPVLWGKASWSWRRRAGHVRRLGRPGAGVRISYAGTADPSSAYFGRACSNSFLSITFPISGLITPPYNRQSRKTHRHIKKASKMPPTCADECCKMALRRRWASRLPLLVRRSIEGRRPQPHD